MAAFSAVAALAACGGSGFESHPPQPRLGSTGLDGVADFGWVPVGTSNELYVFLGNGQIGPETYETLRGISITVEGPELSFDSTWPSEVPQANVCSKRTQIGAIPAS